MPQNSRAAAPKAGGLRFVALLMVFVVTLGLGAWWTGQAIVPTQTVSEGRTVADLAENVGRWASQYGGKTRYRLTAGTVLNRNNAPSEFEREALDSIRAQAVGGDAARQLEYWTVQSGRLLYARAVMAQSSCLQCHGSAETAPEFMRTNLQFNGGGGAGADSAQSAAASASRTTWRPICSAWRSASSGSAKR